MYILYSIVVCTLYRHSIPLYSVEVVDEAHDRESIEPSSYDAGGDCCTYHCKDNDGAKVLEEVALRERGRE